MEFSWMIAFDIGMSHRVRRIFLHRNIQRTIEQLQTWSYLPLYFHAPNVSILIEIAENNISQPINLSLSNVIINCRNKFFACSSSLLLSNVNIEIMWSTSTGFQSTLWIAQRFYIQRYWMNIQRFIKGLANLLKYMTYRNHSIYVNSGFTNFNGNKIRK